MSVVVFAFKIVLMYDMKQEGTWSMHFCPCVYGFNVYSPYYRLKIQKLLNLRLFADFTILARLILKSFWDDCLIFINYIWLVNLKYWVLINSKFVHSCKSVWTVWQQISKWSPLTEVSSLSLTVKRREKSKFPNVLWSLAKVWLVFGGVLLVYG